MKRRYIYKLTYFHDVPVFVGYVDYYIIAKNLKEAKSNVKHAYTHYEFIGHKVIPLTKKHQFAQIFDNHDPKIKYK